MSSEEREACKHGYMDTEDVEMEEVEAEEVETEEVEADCSLQWEVKRVIMQGC